MILHGTSNCLQSTQTSFGARLPDTARSPQRVHKFTARGMNAHQRNSPENAGQTTKAYVARRRAEGRTTKEIMRSPKRCITRRLYRTLAAAHPVPLTTRHDIEASRETLAGCQSEVPQK
jgi:hypothetical protein